MILDSFIRKSLKSIFAFVITGVLICYVRLHWENLRYMWELGTIEIMESFAICFLLVAINGKLLQFVVRAFGVQSGFWMMLGLEHAAQLLNYAPMKIGTFFRAHYLKRHFGLRYTLFGACFMFITFLTISCSSMLGLVALGWGFGFVAYESRILGWILLAFASLSFMMLVLPLKKPDPEGRLNKWIYLLLSGREKLANSKKVLGISVGLLLSNFLLGSLRIGIIYEGLGTNVPIEGYLVLGSLSYVALFVGFTPGALGIREVILSVGAVLLGIPPEVGTLAALIDRAILMIYTFTVGGLFTLYLWRTSPSDFKQTEAFQ